MPLRERQRLRMEASLPKPVMSKVAPASRRRVHRRMRRSRPPLTTASSVAARAATPPA